MLSLICLFHWYLNSKSLNPSIWLRISICNSSLFAHLMKALRDILWRASAPCVEDDREQRSKSLLLLHRIYEDSGESFWRVCLGLGFLVWGFFVSFFFLGGVGIFAGFKQAETSAENCSQYTVKNTLKSHWVSNRTAFSAATLPRCRLELPFWNWTAKFSRSIPWFSKVETS